MASRAPIYRVQLVRDGTVSYDRTPITSSEIAHALVRELMEDADREHTVMLGLDTRNRIIGLHVVSVGTLDCALFPAREVVKAALLMNAAGILLAHNHPSGDPQPSPEDYCVTGQIVAAARLMSLDVIDHLVIGDGAVEPM